MRARMSTAEVQPGKMGEIVSVIQESVYPVYRRQQGFKGVLLLTDTTADRAVSITLWETEADLMAGETSTQRQRAAMAGLVAAPRVTHHYEVSMRD